MEHLMCGGAERTDSRYRGTGLGMGACEGGGLLVGGTFLAVIQRLEADRARTTEGFAVRTPEVGTHDVLTLILAAAEEEDVGPVGVEAHPRGIWTDLDIDPAPAGALRESEHIAAVPIDAHEIRIEVRD